MSEMVERVARAIWIVRATQGAIQRGREPKSREALEREWSEDVTDPENGFYWPILEDITDQARAAIEAMREPTDAMVRASMAYSDDGDGDDLVRRDYQAMIDEALR